MDLAKSLSNDDFFEDIGSFTDGIITYLRSIDSSKFYRVVKPGETLRITVSLTSHRLGLWKFSGCGEVNGEIAVRSSFSAAINK